MNPIRSIANRLVLAPGRDFIDPKPRLRVAIPCVSDEMEAWVYRPDEGDADWFVLKFPGAGGRGEKVGAYPAELFSDRFEVWGINPPGYGTSTGNACVSNMPAVCDAAWKAINQQAGTRPIIVTGTSLGAMYALNVAARRKVAGVFLRHPAPVHQLIRGKHDRWSFGMASRTIGRQISEQMDAAKNAAAIKAPVFVSIAEADRVIPPRFQFELADSFAGKTTQFVLKDGQHHSLVDDSQREEFDELANEWARQVQENLC